MTHKVPLDQCHHAFPVKSKTASILGSAGPVVSVIESSLFCKILKNAKPTLSSRCQPHLAVGCRWQPPALGQPPDSVCRRRAGLQLDRHWAISGVFGLHPSCFGGFFSLAVHQRAEHAGPPFPPTLVPCPSSVCSRPLCLQRHLLQEVLLISVPASAHLLPERSRAWPQVELTWHLELALLCSVAFSGVELTWTCGSTEARPSYKHLKVGPTLTHFSGTPFPVLLKWWVSTAEP